MRTFEFQNNWRPKIELPQLSKLNAEWLLNTNYTDEIFNRNKTGLVEFEILDIHNNEYTPSDNQLEAINYILNHENLIRAEIIESFNTVIIPSIKEKDIDFDLEDNPYPLFDELQKPESNIALLLITILGNSKEDQSFYKLDFEVEFYSGLSVIYHKDNYVKYGYTRSLDDFSLEEELGSEFINPYEYAEEFKFFNPPSNPGENLKPWHLDSNRIYPLKLIRHNKVKAAIEFLNSEKAINTDWDALMSNAKYLKENSDYNSMDEIIEYIERKTKDNTRS